MKKLTNTDAELKKGIVYIKKVLMLGIQNKSDFAFIQNISVPFFKKLNLLQRKNDCAGYCSEKRTILFLETIFSTRNNANLQVTLIYS